MEKQKLVFSTTHVLSNVSIDLEALCDPHAHWEPTEAEMTLLERISHAVRALIEGNNQKMETDQ